MTATTSQFPPRLCNDITVTIANGATESSAGALGGTALLGMVLPAEFDGTSMTFKVSTDGVTYQTFKNLAGVTATAIVAESNSYGIVANDFAAWRFIKLVAGTAQTGNTIITLQTLPL